MKSNTHTLSGLLCARLKSSLWGNLVEQYFWLEIHSKSTRNRSKQKTNMAEVMRACDSDCWPNSFPVRPSSLEVRSISLAARSISLMYDHFNNVRSISLRYDPFPWCTIHFPDVRSISLEVQSISYKDDSFPSKYDPFTKRYDRFPLRYDPFPNFVRNPPP